MDKQECIWCHGTGEINGMGFLDCTHCDAAAERAAVNEFVRANRHLLTQSEIDWAIHQRAVELTEKAEPKRRAEDK